MADSADAEDMAEYLRAAKSAVTHAARLSVRVQRAMTDSQKLVKSDASPVTVADYGCQAIVSHVLKQSLGDFRLMAEEDADTLRKAGADLLDHVVSAVQDACKEEDGVGVTPAGGQLGHGGAGWTADAVLAAIAAGTHAGQQAEGGYWILDPIDGTKGFLRAGQYAVGLAYYSTQTRRLLASAIACPNLPYPCWWDSQGQAVGIAAGGGSTGVRVGTLFYASHGQGAWMEPLPPSSCTTTSGATASEAAEGAVRLTPSSSTAHAQQASSSMANVVLCESFDPGHSNHSVSAQVASALGLGGVSPEEAAGRAAGREPIRIDSMCKYGLLARGDGHLYLRLPRAGYVENVWDHAPGTLLLCEAGGRVTDARGQPLHFTLGRGLGANYGVVATAAAGAGGTPADLHDRVIEELAKLLPRP